MICIFSLQMNRQNYMIIRFIKQDFDERIKIFDERKKNGDERIQKFDECFTLYVKSDERFRIGVHKKRP